MGHSVPCRPYQGRKPTISCATRTLEVVEEFQESLLVPESPRLLVRACKVHVQVIVAEVFQDKLLHIRRLAQSRNFCSPLRFQWKRDISLRKPVIVLIGDRKST